MVGETERGDPGVQVTRLVTWPRVASAGEGAWAQPRGRERGGREEMQGEERYP